MYTCICVSLSVLKNRRKQAFIWSLAPEPELILNNCLDRCSRAVCTIRSMCHCLSVQMAAEERQSWCSGCLPHASPCPCCPAAPAGSKSSLGATLHICLSHCEGHAGRTMRQVPASCQVLALLPERCKSGVTLQQAME